MIEVIRRLTWQHPGSRATYQVQSATLRKEIKVIAQKIKLKLESGRGKTRSRPVTRAIIYLPSRDFFSKKGVPAAIPRLIGL